MYLPKSTMGAVDPIKGLPSALMMCLEKFRFNTNYFNRSLPKIMLYLPLVKSST